MNQKINKSIEYTKVCPICNTEFKTKHPNYKCCSNTCSKIRNKQNHQQYMKKYYDGYSEKVCVMCGNTFKPNSSKSKLCSNSDCKKELHRKHTRQWYLKNPEKIKEIEKKI